MKKFSVIITAYNEAEFIAKPLKELEKQTVPRSDFEIIVVDNNSKDGTAEIARAAGADRIVAETKQGSNFGRQRGFLEATGSIVVFLDADSVPPSGWLARIEKDLEKKGVVAVSGPFDYEFKGIKDWLDYFYSRKILPFVPGLMKLLFGRKAGVIIGGNFAVKRKYLEAIGGLPPLAFWGDDAATAMLLSRKVGKVFYDPKLVVKSSKRRFEHHGLYRSVLRYQFEYLKAYFSKKFN